MIHPVVNSWLITMTTVGTTALKSPIHSPLVATLMNLGRDALALVVALVKFTTLVLHLLQLHYPPSPKLLVFQPKLLVLQLELLVLQPKLLGLQHMPPRLQDIVHITQHQTLTMTTKTILSALSQYVRAIPFL